MCLSKVWEVYKKPKPETIVAWAAFDIENSRLRFRFQSLRERWIVPRRRWLKAAGPRMLASYFDGLYPVGFHKYATRRGAREYAKTRSEVKVQRVLLRRVVAVGEQKGAKVYVAKEMFVP